MYRVSKVFFEEYWFYSFLMFVFGIIYSLLWEGRDSYITCDKAVVPIACSLLPVAPAPLWSHKAGHGQAGMGRLEAAMSGQVVAVGTAVSIVDMQLAIGSRR